MKFEIGWVIVHKASREPAVIVAANDGDTYLVERGFGLEPCEVSGLSIQRADDAPKAKPTTPPLPAELPDTGKTIQAEIDGERRNLRVLGRKPAGLLCSDGHGIHLIRATNAVDEEHFRRLFDSLPAE